jgi:phosphoserine phosphatase RsbU/P
MYCRLLGRSLIFMTFSSSIPNIKAAAINSAVEPQEPVANLASQKQEKIHVILESLGFALRNFKNLKQYLEILPSMITRITDTDAGLVVLFRKNGQPPVHEFYCRSKKNCVEVTQSIEQSLRQILMTLSDRDNNSLYWPEFEAKLQKNLLELDSENRISFFAVKIVMDDGERGCLYVFSESPDYAWSSDRQKLLQIVADQTAVAVINDELTIELRRRDLLNREVEIGAEIQERLLPRQCPDIPGVEVTACYQNANRVSGDYYDFIPANYDKLSSSSQQLDRANKWSIAIGDVMGKGVPAGLIMTMTRGMLRAEVLNGNSPAQILQHLNRVMYIDLENSSRFVTLFYSEYDPITRILSYSNAAHNPPLLWRSTSPHLAMLDTPGMLIGLDPETTYGESQVQLESGDVLMYYTDGLTDAANQNGERFDEENLQAAFIDACCKYQHSQEIIDNIFIKIQTFAGDKQEQSDDMTAVVLRVV